MQRSSTAAIILAAGRGTRASGKVPKQYASIGGYPVLARTLATFLEHPAIDRVKVVIGVDDVSRYEALAPKHAKLLSPIGGGDTRRHSALHGLAALATDPPERVLIHDAARPFVGSDLISRVIAALDHAEAVVPTLPVTSTLKRLDGAGKVVETVPRESLAAAETPQGFRFASIFAAHRKAADEARDDFSDDAALAEWAGIGVQALPGEPTNIKLTTADDIAAADRRLTQEAALALGDIRVGTGYDVHAFGSGDAVFLGGIRIAHSHGLVGHSDADVALHALTDAILGALADGDIGAHFPPSDAQWRGASSDRFLVDAVRRVAARGGRIAHLDVAIIAEAPKIGAHRDAMRERIAAICGISVDRVAVKATTNERLGFIGRGEGIAAHATATIRLPFGTLP